MKITEYEYTLQKAGFEVAGPDVWGKITGEATALIEVSEAETLAWLYLPGESRIMGPKICIQGSPAKAVSEAIFQLNGLLAQQESSGDVAHVELNEVSVEKFTA